MTPKKYIFRASFSHINSRNTQPTVVTIAAADFEEALKKAGAETTAAVAGGKDDPVELIAIKRGESIDVE